MTEADNLPPVQTLRQLFDEVVEASHFSEYATGHEPGPALAIYKEASSAAEALNLLRGYSEFLVGQTIGGDITSDDALEIALETIRQICRDDDPIDYFPTSPQKLLYNRRRDLWKQVFDYFSLDAKAKALLQ